MFKILTTTAMSISVIGWPHPNTRIDLSGHAFCIDYFIKVCCIPTDIALMFTYESHLPWLRRDLWTITSSKCNRDLLNLDCHYLVLQDSELVEPTLESRTDALGKVLQSQSIIATEPAKKRAKCVRNRDKTTADSFKFNLSVFILKAFEE